MGADRASQSSPGRTPRATPIPKAVPHPAGEHRPHPRLELLRRRHRQRFFVVELREYHIPDFSNWKNHAPFESAFAGLFRDLQAQKYIERAGGKSSCTIPAMHSSWPICEFGWHVLIIGMGVEIAITFELHALSDGQGRATHAYKFNSNRTSSQP